MTEPTLMRLQPDELRSHPDNPRLALREDVVGRIAAEIARAGFGAQHAVTARPFDGGYQLVSGHHRVEAARRAGTDVPTWIAQMDDDEAFMQLVLSNTHGELSPLEIGMHALKAVPLAQGKTGGGLAAYADRLGRTGASIGQLRSAAEVVSALLKTSLEVPMDKASHLYEISKAPRVVWSQLVEALGKRSWTVAQTGATVSKVGEFFTPDQNGAKSGWLPIEAIVARHLAQPDRFTPTTVKRLLDAAVQVEDWIKEHGATGDARDFYAWLVEHTGNESWDYRQIIDYRARLVAAVAAKADAEKTAAKLEVPDWHQGSWEDHIGTLRDGSVSLLLTDPPYGTDYQSDYRVDRSVAHRHQVLEGDSNLADAMAALRKCAEQMHPKLADDAHLLVFCTPRTEPDTRSALEAAGYTYRGSLIWLKNNTGMGDPSTTFAPKHERIMHYVKGSPKLLRREPDVLEADRVKTDRHPTEKPVDLLGRLIESCTSRGQRVADPFSGVASTCVAAKEAGRRWWGCEINETYWRAGEERLA